MLAKSLVDPRRPLQLRHLGPVASKVIAVPEERVRGSHGVHLKSTSGNGFVTHAKSR